MNGNRRCRHPQTHVRVLTPGSNAGELVQAIVDAWFPEIAFVLEKWGPTLPVVTHSSMFESMQKKPSGLVCLSFVFAVGCSSSESTLSPVSDAGGVDAANVVDDSEVPDSAVHADATPSSAPCAFAVSGDRAYPSTDSQCQGYLSQSNGSGDYTFNISEAFASPSTTENVTLGLLVNSKTAPAAGDTWTVGADGRGGNSSLTVIKGQTATIWATSDTDAALVKGGTKVTFLSVTKVLGKQKPQDVYYFFEATFEAALNGQSAGTAPLKVTGSAKATTLPFGA